VKLQAALTSHRCSLVARTPCRSQNKDPRGRKQAYTRRRTPSRAAEVSYAGDFLEEDASEDRVAPLRDEARAFYVSVNRALAELYVDRMAEMQVPVKPCVWDD
jgi:hypothetical protein